MPAGPSAYVDLYWIPLGAGGHSVRLNGCVYEAIVALLEQRDRRDLYHAALEIEVERRRYTIESTPVPPGDPVRRGAVAGGPVGSRFVGRWRIFRYEVRCSRDGVIPDRADAVDSPRRLSEQPDHVRRILELVPELPGLVWGRDERGTGDMWNSNSIIAWLLIRAGVEVTRVVPPVRGRAPGWRAGVVLGRASSP